MTAAIPARELAHRERFASTFFSECFIDDLARAAWRDPVQYRREMLPPSSRLRRVLDAAARASGWSRPLPAGRARGIALSTAQGAMAAHVAELSVDEHGESRVHRIVAVLDCGQGEGAEAARRRLEASLRERWALLVPPPELDVQLLRSEAPPARGDALPDNGLAPAMANALATIKARAEVEEVMA
jgi:hypothetical protein